jgi:leucyl-tRNA synthetase
MFMGPMDGYPDFRDTGIEGMYRFVGRVWDVLTGTKDVLLDKEQGSTLRTKLHRSIRKVTDDIEGFRYNTAISAIMELVGLMKEIAADTPAVRETDDEGLWIEAKRTLTLLLAPFAPHLAEEVWVNYLKQDFSVHGQMWPVHDPQLLIETTVNLVVQVNGKLRGTISMTKEKGNQKEEVVSAARSQAAIAKWLDGKEVIKEIFVPEKLVNFVVR